MTHPVRLLLHALVALAALRTSASPLASAPTPAGQLERSVTALRGEVRRAESFRDDASGRIHTRVHIRVQEVFKGVCPRELWIVLDGGTVGDSAQADGMNPVLREGEERLLFLSRRPDGTLRPTLGHASAIHLAPGGSSATAAPASWQESILAEVRTLAAFTDTGEDVTDQAAPEAAPALDNAAGFSPPTSSFGSLSNLLMDQYGYHSRHVAPDHAEPIPYLLDGQTMPSGITSNQALAAVQTALNAWTNVAPLRFAFEGWTNFGNAAMSETNLTGTYRRDGKLRIQLHDLFNVITEPDVLGRSGWNANGFLTIDSGWGSGGLVSGCEIYRTRSGYVHLEHTAAELQNTNTLIETLCHEIGHALGLAHTSENPFEPTNSPLYQSIMYYRIHGDGRGASLGTIDGPNLRQLHPTNNTPPFTFPRLVDIVTATTLPTNAGVNRIQIAGHDLDGATLTYATNDAFGTNGSFSLGGNLLSFLPSVVTNRTRLPAPVDPAVLFDEYFDQVFIRVADGTNASAYEVVNTVSFGEDKFPANQSDGLPDTWMLAHFGTVDPAGNPSLGPNGDFDGDGYTNFQEFLMGSHPARSWSNLRLLVFTGTALTFEARPYDVYTLETSTNASLWTPLGFSLQPIGTNGAFTNLPSGQPGRYFRVRRVP